MKSIQISQVTSFGQKNKKLFKYLDLKNINLWIGYRSKRNKFPQIQKRKLTDFGIFKTLFAFF
jgi:hypothetical protein